MCLGGCWPVEPVPGSWSYIVWFGFLLLEELGCQYPREQKHQLSYWFQFLYTWKVEKCLIEMDRRHCRSSSSSFSSLCLQYQRT